MPFLLIFLCLNISPGGAEDGKNTKLDVSGLNFSKSKNSIFGDFEPPPSDRPSGGPKPIIYTIKAVRAQNPQIFARQKLDLKRHFC